MRKAAALKIISLNKPITSLSVKELKALVRYKKIKDDGAVPTAKKGLLEMYEAICFRAYQTLETYLSSLGHQ